MTYTLPKSDTGQAREFARRAGEAGRKIAVRSWRALIWSWPVGKVVYRTGAQISAAVFVLLWLCVLGTESGFSDFTEQFLDDVRTFFEMAAHSLGLTCRFVVVTLTRLPVIIGIPAAVLFASFVVY